MICSRDMHELGDQTNSIENIWPSDGQTDQFLHEPLVTFFFFNIK